MLHVGLATLSMGVDPRKDSQFAHAQHAAIAMTKCRSSSSGACIGMHYSAIDSTENPCDEIKEKLRDIVTVQVKEKGNNSQAFNIHRFVLGPMFNLPTFLQTKEFSTVTKNYVQYCVDRAISRNELIAAYLKRVYQSDDKRDAVTSLDAQLEFEVASYTLDEQYMQHLYEILSSLPSRDILKSWKDNLEREGPFYDFVKPLLEYVVPFSEISNTVIAAGPQAGRPTEPIDPNDEWRVTKHVKDMLRGSRFKVTDSGRVELADGEMDRGVTEGTWAFWMDEVPSTETAREKLLRWADFNDKLKELLKRKRK